MDAGTVVAAGLRILRVEGRRLWAGRGSTVLTRDGEGQPWREDGHLQVSPWRGLAGKVAFLRRVTRGGIACLLPLPDGARLAVTAGGIHRAEPGATVFRCVFPVERGSRPLSLARTPDGRVWWGEYFLNLLRRQPVRIFVSGDGGLTWEVARTFQPGDICHVHRIVHDPHDDSLLACTGDRDGESRILRSRDGFRNLELLAGGSQQFRTACLVPLPDCILYGTDNPGGPNHLCALDRFGQAREIQEVPGPVIHSCRAGKGAAFATMVERDGHEATLWYGDARGFTCLLHLPVTKVHRVWRELVGYATIILPDGEGMEGRLYCTPEGTRQHGGTLLELPPPNLEQD
jgi:hypothetical protein